MPATAHTPNQSDSLCDYCWASIAWMWSYHGCYSTIYPDCWCDCCVMVILTDHDVGYCLGYCLHPNEREKKIVCLCCCCNFLKYSYSSNADIYLLPLRCIGDWLKWWFEFGDDDVKYDDCRLSRPMFSSRVDAIKWFTSRVSVGVDWFICDLVS